MQVNLRSIPALGALLALGLLAGCGGDDGGDGGASVAEIAPADAPLYFEADVRPEGEQKENLESFLSAVLATDDPGSKIEGLIDEGFKSEGEEKTFADDVEPWLGETAGVFVTGTEDDPPAVVAVEATDTEQGLELLRAESSSVTDSEHEGVSYQLDEDGSAFGAIDDFVALGDESAFKAAIEASEGDSLADAERFTNAISDIPDDALGQAYLDLKALIGAGVEEEGIPAESAGKAVEKLGIDDALVASFESGDRSLAVDVGGLGDLGGEPPQLLAELPADATFAVGIADVGDKLKGLINAVESAGIPGLGKGSVAALLQAGADIDVEEDLTSWLGDAALFIRGTDPATLDGALVFESTDDAAAALTLDKLRSVVESQGQGSPEPLELGSGGNGFMLESPDFPQPLNFVQQNGKLVVGVGEVATQLALTPSKTLADAAPFAAASGALGDSGPSFFASLPELVTLIAADDALSAEDFEQAKPYLDRLSYLTAGGGEGGVQIILGAK